MFVYCKSLGRIFIRAQLELKKKIINYNIIYRNAIYSTARRVYTYKRVIKSTRAKSVNITRRLKQLKRNNNYKWVPLGFSRVYVAVGWPNLSQGKYLTRCQCPTSICTQVQKKLLSVWLRVYCARGAVSQIEPRRIIA